MREHAVGDLISVRCEGMLTGATAPDTLFMTSSYSALLVLEESGATLYD